MTVPYVLDSSASHYKHYYVNQAGGRMNIFHGKTIQTGNGLGNVFSKIFKGIAPVLKQAAKSGGRELLKSGSKVVSDVLEGKSFAESAQRNFTDGGKNLLKTLTSSVNPKLGGTKRKRKQKKSNSPLKTKKRRLTNDIFA